MKLLAKYCVLFLSIPLLLWFYLSYSPGTKQSEPILNQNEVINKDKNEDPNLEGIDIFKNNLDRFEDMYNFHSGLQSLIKNKSKNVKLSKHEIEIWGKASLAEYLWCHVFDANATTYANGLLKHGEMTFQNLHFRYRSGPGIIQQTVPSNIKNLILVLNGKDDRKIKFSKSWLDYLVHFKYLKNVAVVMLGDEQCNNDWILPYLKSRGGVVDLVFLTYDSALVDNREFFQWPLGVATYRGFPNFKSNHIKVDKQRQYLCNFLGTIYKNSSRETLGKVLDASHNFSGKCFVLSRDTWVPSETYESVERYLNILANSDLTLSPVGQNTECYRTYEALSLGSVPVVENVLTPGRCDLDNNSPLRLLKEYNAPIILINDWNDLNDVLQTELKMSLQVKIERRKRVIKWYENFKAKMKTRFLEIIKKYFFKEEL